MNDIIKHNIQQRIDARKEEKRKLTPFEAAEFLRVNKRTMDNWRGKGIGPAHIKTGGKVFYFKADLEKFERRIER